MDAPHDTETIDDLSALAWVHDELRRSLESAHKALRRHLKEADALGQSDVDAVDPAILRSAKVQFHQGVGALELVGLRAAATVLRASEAAVVRFTETLAVEVCEAGIDVNALAPGALNTAMLDEILAAGPERVGEYYQKALRQKESGGSSLGRAAALCVSLLAAETDRITGRLISAVWDPWEMLPKRKDALNSSDVYTLRRITPGDRGLDWDKV